MLVLSLLVPTLLPLFTGGDDPDDTPNDTAVPNFVLPAVGGGDVSLTDVAGSHRAIVVVFHRGYDCAACRTQLMEIQSGYSALANEGAEVLAIGLESQESAQQTEDHVNASFPVLYDPNGTIARAYGIDDDLAADFTTAIFVLDDDLNLTVNPVGTRGEELLPVSALLNLIDPNAAGGTSI